MCFEIIALSRLTRAFAFPPQTADDFEVEVSLLRVDGSLGFNIMGGSEVRSFLISYFITALCVFVLLCHLVGNSRLVINLILTRNARSRAIKQRNHAFVNLALIFYFPDHIHV